MRKKTKPVERKTTLATKRRNALNSVGADPRIRTRSVPIAWKIRPEIKALMDDLSIEITIASRTRVTLADIFEEAIEFFARNNYPELAERHLTQSPEHRTDAGEH